MLPILIEMLDKDLSEEKHQVVEDELIRMFEEVIKEPSFYKLSTQKIADLVRKSGINDVNSLCILIDNMVKEKGEEATLILNTLELEEDEIENYVKVLSHLKCSPMLKKLKYLYDQELRMVLPDVEYDVENLKKEIRKLSAQVAARRFPRIDFIPYNYEDSIYKAAKKGDLLSVQYYAQSTNENINKQSTRGTALHYAAYSGHLSIVKYLVEEAQANINDRNKNKRTPLMVAAWAGNLDIVAYLVECCHALLYLKDERGENALHYAAGSGRVDVFRYLVQKYQMALNDKDDRGYTPIDWARHNGKQEIIDMWNEMQNASNLKQI